ncbi:hypothetical protein SUGI_0888830 [Cryptomeria japonica]|nr:hypothetical protein SUGI_0888830 [Cryptomeria japonica]
MRIWGVASAALSFAELFISSTIHMCYGFYIFSTAVALDLVEIINCHRLLRSRIWNIWAWEADSYTKPNIVESNGNDKGIGNGPYFQGNELVPIVLVHGIFGFGKGRLGGMSYWAGAEKKDDRVLVPDLGSLTSIYDRARELFYYLKGGTVDYGEEHSARYGHAQFGKTYEQGHYPEWDEDHPAHFVGHSSGAQVIRVLQQMLAEKKFKGYENSSEDWVLSVTSMSGALNGATRVYLDGIEPEDGKMLKPICLLQLCRVGVIIYDWLDIAWLKNYYNFGFDHFNMTWRRIGISGLVDSLLGNIGPFASEDWILPDLSLQLSVELNKKLRTFPKTYYFSYATKKTTKLFGVTVPSSLFGVHPLFFIRTLQMSQWRLPSNLEPPFKGYNDEDWQDNDGALNTISMLYPRFPEVHPNCCLNSEFKDGQSFQPGVWYYTIVEADHILFIINRERAGVQFDVLYDGIFQRLRKEMARGVKTIDGYNNNRTVWLWKTALTAKSSMKGWKYYIS